MGSVMVMSTWSAPICSPPGPAGKLSVLDRRTLKLSPSSDRLSSTAEKERQIRLPEEKDPGNCPRWPVVGL